MNYSSYSDVLWSVKAKFPSRLKPFQEFFLTFPKFIMKTFKLNFLSVDFICVEGDFKKHDVHSNNHYENTFTNEQLRGIYVFVV